MKTIFSVLFLLLIKIEINAQESNINIFENKNFSFKVSGYVFIGGGSAISIGFGVWNRGKIFQPAASINSTFSYGVNHIGNNSRQGNTTKQGNNSMQWNIIISPMLTINLGTYDNTLKWRDGMTGVWEEIPTLYLNNANTIYSNYYNAFTFGSSFITTPKGFGRNYTTSRNRSQQLAFFQLKKALSKQANFQFNIVEDVGPEFLADKWDRYITGGGSVQLRINQNIKLKAYSEIYTGTTQRDMIDFPDITYARKDVGVSDTTKHSFFHWAYRSFSGGIKRTVNYAMQEPSQKIYNQGRSIYGIDFNTSIFYSNQQDLLYYPQHHHFFNYSQKHYGNIGIYWLRQGGGTNKISPKAKENYLSHGPMWSQNVIHVWGKGDLLSVNVSQKEATQNDKIPFMTKGDYHLFLPKHWFEPYIKNRINTFGIAYGLNLN